MKLLVVDDDPMILELLLEALPGLGYPDVTGASSGAEAMQAIAQSDSPFDCFLLDIQMPEMTGIELCSWLRDHPDYAQIPVLMITAMSERSFIDQSFAAGATDYITKPFNPQELSQRMKQAEQLNRDRMAAFLPPAASSNETAHPVQQRLEMGIAPFALQTPFNIAEVRGVVDLLALENYLLQLGRGGMIASACFAYQIGGIQRLYDSCSPDEYYYTIADIAEAIAESLAYYETFVSHAGNGAFVCVAHGHNLPAEEDLIAEVRDRLHAMELQYDDGRPMLVAVSHSPYLRLGLRSGASAVAQLDRAIEQASAAGEVAHAAPQRLRPVGLFTRLFRFAQKGFS